MSGINQTVFAAYVEIVTHHKVTSYQYTSLEITWWNLQQGKKCCANKNLKINEELLEGNAF